MTLTCPFPTGPFASAFVEAERPMTLREFGTSASDLSVEFDEASRVEVVTDLLLRCGQTIDGDTLTPDVVWGLPVSVRTRAVLALAAMASPRPFEWHVRCPFCGEGGEFSLAFAELEAYAQERPGDERIPILLETSTAWVRRPTGADQLAWMQDIRRGLSPARSILEQILIDTGGAPQDTIIQAIDGVMDEFDPLVNFSVEVGCHECGHSAEHEVDLTEAALQRLWKVLFDRVEEIHRLASAYHWSEVEILALPAWRRKTYLAHIGGGEL